MKTILRRVESHTQNTLQKQPSSSNTNTLAIDQIACRVLVGDDEVVVTKAQYQLLLTLYKNRGRVFSREQLLNAINEDPGAAMDRVIDAHIKSLRAKLREKSVEVADLIETRRGLGYLLKSH